MVAEFWPVSIFADIWYAMRWIVSLIALWISPGAFTQPEKPTFLMVDTKGGILFAHRPFMSHLVRENSFGFELTALQQQTGNDQHTVLHRCPLKGIGLEFRNFGYNQVLGSAISITGFMNFPLVQTQKNLCFDLLIGTGLGYITRHYDKYENPTNNAIGSALNAKVSVKFALTKYARFMHFGGGIEFAHYSNGTIKTPNLGLNSPSLFLRAGYNFSERVVGPKRINKEKTNCEFSHNLSAELIGTGKEIGAVPFEPQLYPVAAGRLGYTYSKCGLWGAELALDIIHNEANFHKYNDTTFVRSDILQVGIYAGGFVQFYQMQLAFGLGYYVRDIINAEGLVYNRVGYRWYFCENWFGLFNVKANYGKADYFEFGIGYRFLKW